MATKKTTPKKATEETSLINKIAEGAGHLVGEFNVGKQHLAEVAGNVIESVKSTIGNLTTKKAIAPAKKAVKKAVKKVEKAVVKKAAPAKKAIKKAVKKVAPAKKAIKKVVKKAAPAKKAIKKAIKKVAKKK